jgi:hypothetical protein
MAKEAPVPPGLNEQDAPQYEHDRFLMCHKYYTDTPRRSATGNGTSNLPEHLTKSFETINYPRSILRAMDGFFAANATGPGTSERVALDATAFAWILSCLASRGRVQRRIWRTQLGERFTELAESSGRNLAKPSKDQLYDSLGRFCRELAKDTDSPVTTAAAIYLPARLAVESAVTMVWRDRELTLNKHLLNALAPVFGVMKVLPLVDRPHLELSDWCERQAKYEMGSLNTFVQDAVYVGLEPFEDVLATEPERSAFRVVMDAVGANPKDERAIPIMLRSIRQLMGSYYLAAVRFADKTAYEVVASADKSPEDDLTSYSQYCAEGLAKCLAEVAEAKSGTIDTPGLAPWDRPETWMDYLQSYRWISADAHNTVREIHSERWELIQAGVFGDVDSCSYEDVDQLLSWLRRERATDEGEDES